MNNVDEVKVKKENTEEEKKENTDEGSFSYLYIFFVICYFALGIGAAYYSYNKINKGQETLPKILISINAFFMNISYFIKIGFLKLIGYKWYDKL